MMQVHEAWCNVIHGAEMEQCPPHCDSLQHSNDPQHCPDCRTAAGRAPMDYRALLIRYMDHVGNEEGTVFLSRRPSGRFSDDEWFELTQLASTELPSDPPRALVGRTVGGVALAACGCPVRILVDTGAHQSGCSYEHDVEWLRRFRTLYLNPALDDRIKDWLITNAGQSFVLHTCAVNGIGPYSIGSSARAHDIARAVLRGFRVCACGSGHTLLRRDHGLV